jgi:HlyD family secretion protein
MKRLFLLLFLASLLAACASPGAGQPTPTPAPTPVVAQKPTYTVQRGAVTRTLRLTGRVTPVNQQDLFFRADGFVREVYMARGDQVEEGAVLARLDDPEKFQADVAAAELELEQARFDLDELHRNAPVEAAKAQVALAEAQKALDEARKGRTNLDYPRVSDELTIQKAEADYLLAKDRVKEAQKDFDKVAHKRLTDPERVMTLNALLDAKREMDRLFAIYNWLLLPATPNELAQADADLALAEAEYEAALRSWELLKDGPTERAVLLAEAKVTDAEATLAIAQKALANIELRAPFAGEVLSINLSPGTQVTAFRAVLTLADPNELEITAFPTQEELRDLGVGQAAVLQLSSRPGEDLPAQVVQVPVAGAGQDEEADRQDQAVHIQLQDPGIPLTLNEAVTLTIELETRQDVLWLPPAALRTFQGREFVFVEENGVQRRVDVILGLRGPDRIEIVSGLTEGQVVIGQ